MMRSTFQSVMCDPAGDGSHRVVARVAYDDSIPESERLSDSHGTLEFIAPPGSNIKAFEPGSFITVRVTECKTPAGASAEDVHPNNSGGIPTTPRLEAAPVDVPTTPPTAAQAAPTSTPSAQASAKGSSEKPVAGVSA